MKKAIITASLLACFVICYALISGISGKWLGSLNLPNGQTIPITYILKADSGKLTGTVIGPDGELPITNAKIKGNEFSFNIEANGQTIANTGKYYQEADTIGIDLEGANFKLHSTLKRDK